MPGGVGRATSTDSHVFLYPNLNANEVSPAAQLITMKNLLFKPLLLLLGLLAAISVSAEETFVENGLMYTITSTSDKEVKVSGIEADVYGDIVIPSYTSQGYKVVDIGENSFSDSYVKSVEIPTTVTTINPYAFYSAKFLMSISIPNSVTSIGESAFCKCSSLTSVIIPDAVTTIGDDAFCKCSSLTSVTIPNSVTSIGAGAFYGCSSLTSVTIPNSVTSIGDETFYRCSSLTSVTIPNSVTTIGDDAFYGCSSLTSVTIPNSVTSIGYGAFYRSSLTKVSALTENLTVIPGCCFMVSNLTEIELGRNIKKIEALAFYEDTHAVFKCHTNIPPSVELAMVGIADFWRDYSITECTLYVPVGCGYMYERTYPWSNFRNIYETLEWSGIDGVIDDIDSPQEVGVFDIQGRPVDKDNPGMVIIKYSDGSAKKIINK